MSSPDTTQTPDGGVASPSLRRPSTADGVRWARQAWKDFAYLVVGLVTGTLVFSIVVTVVSLTLSLLVLIIGVPVGVWSSKILRWCAELERRRALIVDGRPIHGVYRPLPKGMLAQAKAMAVEPRRWKEIVYPLVQFPVTVGGFCVTTTGWAVALSGVAYPLYFWALPDDGHSGWNIGSLHFDTLPLSLVVMLAGIVAVPVAYWLSRGCSLIEVALTRYLLGDDRDLLQARVSHLEETRSGAVDAASSELRRIERDLHDGAQARMVSVAMDLGMAEERMAHDPEGARDLVQGARAEARRALSEMRDLVRGIAPSVLADRGLDAALSSLVARAAVPVLLDIDLPRRPPSTVETAAYFVVSEALVNVAKHATADSCQIVVRGEDDAVTVRVEDDGTGGAQLLSGGGLSGLRDRVAALDGTLAVESPVGGPTILQARIPCAF